MGGATQLAPAWRGTLPVRVWPIFDGTGLDAFVTTRAGGVSEGPYASLNLALTVDDDRAAVVENRRRVSAAAGTTLDRMVFAQQVHGCEVTEVGAADAGRGSIDPLGAVGNTDALVTSDPSVALVIMVADCVPVVVFDPVEVGS